MISLLLTEEIININDLWQIQQFLLTEKPKGEKKTQQINTM